MRIFVSILVGVMSASVVNGLTDYSLYQWQWWALSLAIIIPLITMFNIIYEKES